MFFEPHTALVATVHTGIGFVLLGALMWHIYNNVANLKNYYKWHSSKAGVKVNWTMLVAMLFSVALISLAMAQALPFVTLYEWGNKLRAGGKSEENIQFSYIRVDNTQADAQGNKLVIDLRKGSYFRWPQYAIWLETLDGKFIQPLYVTQKLAENKFANKVTLRDQKQVFNTDISNMNDETWEKTFATEWSPETAVQRTRPESLPVFLHQLTSSVNAFTSADQITSNNSHINHSTIDGFAGATMLENFLLSSRSHASLPDSYKVRFEINQSFDFNSFYSSDRFPDDPIYSGNGYSGQPSVIYEAIIDTRSTQQYYPMTLIGRGHHSGGDGDIHTDMDNLTTAKELIDRIIVEVRKN